MRRAVLGEIHVRAVDSDAAWAVQTRSEHGHGAARERDAIHRARGGVGKVDERGVARDAPRRHESGCERGSARIAVRGARPYRAGRRILRRPKQTRIAVHQVGHLRLSRCEHAARRALGRDAQDGSVARGRGVHVGAVGSDAERTRRRGMGQHATAIGERAAHESRRRRRPINAPAQEREHGSIAFVRRVEQRVSTRLGHARNDALRGGRSRRSCKVHVIGVDDETVRRRGRCERDRHARAAVTRKRSLRFGCSVVRVGRARVFESGGGGSGRAVVVSITRIDRFANGDRLSIRQVLERGEHRARRGAGKRNCHDSRAPRTQCHEGIVAHSPRARSLTGRE